MSEGQHFVGVRMDAERANALRVLAARKNISLAELVRRATEAQYGDEMDIEVSRSAAPGVLTSVSKRQPKKAKAS
jgi:hypothetical protein